MNGRTRKIESQLKEIVAEEVDTLSDPRIRGLVTVTGVRVNPDLSGAAVFYSVLAGEEDEEVRAEAQEGLQSAAGRLQSVVNARTRLRRTPRLRFEPDPVVDRVLELDNAFREVKGDRGPHE